MFTITRHSKGTYLCVYACSMIIIMFKFLLTHFLFNKNLHLNGFSFNSSIKWLTTFQYRPTCMHALPNSLFMYSLSVAQTIPIRFFIPSEYRLFNIFNSEALHNCMFCWHRSKQFLLTFLSFPEDSKNEFKSLLTSQCSLLCQIHSRILSECIIWLLWATSYVNALKSYWTWREREREREKILVLLHHIASHAEYIAKM